MTPEQVEALSSQSDTLFNENENRFESGTGLGMPITYSIAEIMKAEAIGVVLTGMGADGARGLKLMRNAGAKTIGQNEATCVVYGMPKVAKDLGAVMYELPLENIGAKIMSFV
jgi:chemotaxis response regulator CheB